MKLSSWFAFAFALACPLSSSFAAEWFTLPNSPVAPGRHDDVWFTDELNGWVVNGEGEIWHTRDGGSSWQQQAAVPEYLRSVTFVSPLHGWAGTLFSTNRLYETTNGGASWNSVPNLPPPISLGICGMWAASADVVYAVGMYAMPASILKTTNAGGSWSYLDVTGLARTLIDCYFPSPNTGFVVGSVGTFPDSSRAIVLRTTNGGANWSTQYVSSRLGEWGWKISFPSASIGYVSVERSSGPMMFLKTTNGGMTWMEKPCPNFNEQGIGFLDDQVGWVGGWGSPTFSTTNGGETWQSLNFIMQNLNRIRFLGNGLAFAVGKRVYRYGTDPTDLPPMLVGDVAALSPSFPNPFTASASIGFTLLNAADVKLGIFDLAGRCVQTIVSARTPAGTHRAAWDGRDAAGFLAPSGVYFWRLETAGRAESRKVLLVR